MVSLEEISIEVTNKCGLNCIHCSSEAGKKYENELTLGEIKNIIDQSKMLGARTLTLSGGEPLLREDLFEVINYARTFGFEIRLQTSGVYNFNSYHNSIPESVLEKFTNNMAIKDKIVFSVLGLEKAHEKITRLKGSYNTTLESLRKAKKHGIKTEVHTVVHSINYNQMKKIKKILCENGADSWHLLRLVPQGRCSSSLELMLNKEQFKEFKADMSELLMENNKLEIVFGHHLLLGEACCLLGKTKILIRPDGIVTYCAALKEGFGNIREKSLAYFWNDHEWVNHVRNFLKSGYREIKGKCQKCDSLETCKAGCVAQRLYAHADLNKGPDPLCYTPLKKK